MQTQTRSYATSFESVAKIPVYLCNFVFQFLAVAEEAILDTVYDSTNKRSVHRPVVALQTVTAADVLMIGCLAYPTIPDGCSSFLFLANSSELPQMLS